MQNMEQVPEPARLAALGMRSELLAYFGDGLAAVWLYGASVFGDAGIDVDLHVLLRDAPEEPHVTWLRGLDPRVAQQAGVKEIDCWYITLEDASSPGPPRDLRHVDLQDKHWPLHRAHWLAGAVVVVHGLSPQDVLLPVSWPELESTLRHEVEDATARLNDGNAYWTLQLCRVLASLETHDVVRSKLDSAAWALERLAPNIHPVIEAAVRYYRRTANPADKELIRSAYPALFAAVRSHIDRL
jgi:hypothetical protein